MPKRVTTEQFISRSRLVHADKYTYEKSIYSGTNAKLTITCPLHGDFLQTPGNHLQGAGCSMCGGTNKLSTAKFISKALSVHGERYDYSLAAYKSSEEGIKVICREHGVFTQRARYHLEGRGCPACNKAPTGFSRSIYIDKCSRNHAGIAKLYVVRCFGDSESFYKVGITSRTISHRFSPGCMPYNVDIIAVLEGGAGDIWDLEKKIHKRLSKLKYSPRQSFGGATECFIEVPQDLIAHLSAIGAKLHLECNHL